MIKRLLAGIVIALFVGTAPGLLYAADTVAGQEPVKNAQPIHIEADGLESLQEKNAVVFTGNVEAKQGDVLINADVMRVYYADETDNGKELSLGLQKVKKFYAEGHVTVVKEGWIATGDNVEYFGDVRKVLLTGNARVYQDNNMITGDSVTLFLDEGRSIVKKSGDEGGGRVKAVIYPAAQTEEEK